METDETRIAIHDYFVVLLFCYHLVLKYDITTADAVAVFVATATASLPPTFRLGAITARSILFPFDTLFTVSVSIFVIHRHSS